MGEITADIRIKEEGVRQRSVFPRQSPVHNGSLDRLTSAFEMRAGVSGPLWPPTHISHF